MSQSRIGLFRLVNFKGYLGGREELFIGATSVADFPFVRKSSVH